MNRFWKSRRVRFAAAGAAALAVGLLASLGAVGYAARIVGVTGASPVAAQYPPSKVTICHHTHSQKNPFVTITVSERALPAHLRHGDTMGPCTAQASVPTVKQAKPSAKKQKPQHFSHKQKGKKSHLNGQEHSTAKGSNGLNQGQGHGQGQSKGQDQASAQSQGHGQGKAQGHAYGPGKEHGPGSGQTHGQGATNGHGHGNGNGPGTDHGTSGGGNGKGHKK